MSDVRLGTVRAFPGVKPDKEQALKPLEESAEAFGAWQVYANGSPVQLSSHEARDRILDETADTIQACCNLAASLGVHDLTPYLARCEERNRERGRYDRP